jgi:hypothetical protein
MTFKADPATKAARKMDWDSFMAGWSARDQAIIQFMIEGKSCCAMARQLKACDSTIRTSKKNLALEILEFMGINILVDIQRRPQWKDSINASREKPACRDQRRHCNRLCPINCLASVPAPVAFNRAAGVGMEGYKAGPLAFNFSYQSVAVRKSCQRATKVILGACSAVPNRRTSKVATAALKGTNST